MLPRQPLEIAPLNKWRFFGGKQTQQKQQLRKIELDKLAIVLESSTYRHPMLMTANIYGALYVYNHQQCQQQSTGVDYKN